MVDNNRAVARAEPNVFLAFDRLDDDQIVAEMKGAALNEYVYEFTEGGQTVRGLSKVGTDDAARIMAVKYGEALREVDCWLERDDDEAGYFKAKVARFIIKDDGTAIEMDSSIGHKRQPKSTVLRSGQAKLNPFWYEQGGQKALRNAKQKLMPETIKQAIIAMYVQQGKVRQVRADEVAGTVPQQPQRPASAATAKSAPIQSEKPTQPPTPPPTPNPESRRVELLDALKEVAKRSPKGWPGLLDWWPTQYAGTPETADVATLQAAYGLLNPAKGG